MLLLPAAAAAAAAAAVRHRMPDGQISYWFIESDPSVFFLFVQTRIAGMRGAMAGVSPPCRSPPCKYMDRFVDHAISVIEKPDLYQDFRRRHSSSR